MRHLDRDTRGAQLVKQADLVLDRDSENLGKRGRRDHLRSGKYVHRGTRMGRLAAIGYTLSRVKPSPLQIKEQIKPNKRRGDGRGISD